MDPGDSVYAYWDWKPLRVLLDAVWSALDVASSRLNGAPIPALVYASLPDRLSSDIETLFSAAQVGQVSAVESVVRRPPRNKKYEVQGSVSPRGSTSLLLANGTLRTSIFVTMIVLKEATEISLGDLLSETSRCELSDEDLLEFLDNRVKRTLGTFDRIETPEGLLVARFLSEAFEVEMRQAEEGGQRSTLISVCDVLRMTEESANWSGLADLSVVDRLKRIIEVGAADTARSKQIKSEAVIKAEKTLREKWR
jgi:hypothetical protein